MLRAVESRVATAFERNRDLIIFSERLGSVEAYDVTAINDFLTSLVISHEPVAAAYYWRVDDRLVYRHDTYSQLEDHAFSEVIRDLRTEPGPGFRFAWFTRLYVPEFQEDSGGERAVGMVVGYPLLQLQKKAYVVVAIPADRLQQWLLLDSDEAVSSLEISDLYTGERVFAVNANENTVWLHEHPDSARGLYYRAGIVPAGGYGLVQIFVWAFIPLAAILIIAGVGWAVAVTIGRNRLLDAIISTVRGAAAMTIEPSAQDEFHFLQTAVDELVQRATAVEDSSARIREFRIGHVFANLIERTDSPDRVQQELERLVPNHMQTRMCCVIVELDQYFRAVEQYGEADLGLLKFALRQAVDELAQEQFDDAWTRWIAAERLAVLGFADSQQAEGPAGASREFAEGVRAWSDDHLPFSVTVAIGRLASSWMDVAASYDEATRVLSLKAIMGMNRILTEEDLQSQASKAVFGLYPDVDRLVSQLLSGRSEWSDTYGAILGEMRVARLPKRDIARLVSYVVFVLERDIQYTATPVRELWRNEIAPELGRLATQLDVLENLAPRVSAFLAELAEAVVVSLQDDWLARAVVEIEEHVRANLNDASLSLDLYSDAHDIHRSQLSRAFKKYSGRNFVDFLISVRMERAKQLLSDPDARVDWVAAEVGYTHPFSFSRTFHRYVGMSPSQFQKTHRAASKSSDGAESGTNSA